MHLESTISALGLPKKGAQVYLACLQLGPASMSQISRSAGFKRPTTYLIVDDLMRRGFVTSSKKGAKTLYHAEAPRKLLNMAHFRARQLERVLPELEALYDEPKEKPRIKIYEGLEAMKHVYDEMYAHLGKRNEALFFTPIDDIEATHPEILKYFQRQLHRRRDFCIRELLRDDPASRAYAQRMKSLQGSHHHIRILDPKYAFGFTDNFIYGNKLIIFSLRSEIFVIEIENSDIADTYRALFNAAWEYGKEV